MLSLTASVGSISSQAGVVITIVLIAQQAASLQARVRALHSAGVLNAGLANSLIVRLNLQFRSGWAVAASVTPTACAFTLIG
jgi:hypothetical protein